MKKYVIRELTSILMEEYKKKIKIEKLRTELTNSIHQPFIYDSICTKAMALIGFFEQIDTTCSVVEMILLNF